MFRNFELKPVLQKWHNSFVHLILYLDILSVWWSLMNGIFSSLPKNNRFKQQRFFYKTHALEHRDNLKLSSSLGFHVEEYDVSKITCIQYPEI